MVTLSCSGGRPGKYLTKGRGVVTTVYTVMIHPPGWTHSHQIKSGCEERMPARWMNDRRKRLAQGQTGTGRESRTRTPAPSPPIADWKEPLCPGAADAASTCAGASESCAIKSPPHPLIWSWLFCALCKRLTKNG